MLFEDDSQFSSFDAAEQKARAALELYEQGDYQQAIIELDAAIEANPTNSSLHFNKALILDSLGQFEQAVEAYKAALELNPYDIEILNCIAVDHTRMGLYDLALRIFEQVQQMDPAFEASYCNRIITYTEMGQHDLAEQMFYLGQQFNSDCPLCYYNIGNNLFVRGLFKKAIHCWQRTASLEPTHPQINFRIAQACWSDKNYPLAEQYFLKELRIDPGNSDVIFEFGLLLLEAGKIDSAKEKFNRLLELQPDMAIALFYLGEIAFNYKEYQKATELFKLALQKDSNLVGPNYRLGEYELMQNNIDQARSYLLAELKLAPEDADTLVSIASMLIETNDINHAVTCLTRAIEIDHQNANAYYYLGTIHFQKSRLEDAEEFFIQTLKINPDHIAALRDMSILYFTAGKNDQAIKNIRKAIELDPGDEQLKQIDSNIQQMMTGKNLKSIIKKTTTQLIKKV